MFDRLDRIPLESKYAVEEEFQKDPHPRKFNLHTGVYKNDQGECAILSCVRRAEERVLRAQATKNYLDIAGAAEFRNVTQELLLGRVTHAATVQTPGGTAALRVAGEFVRAAYPNARMWLPEPTWTNHHAVFAAAGLQVRTYPHAREDEHALAFEAMIGALEAVPEGDVVLF